MNKIRKGDEVIVLAGRDKGKRGIVSLRKDDSFLLVAVSYTHLTLPTILLV